MGLLRRIGRVLIEYDRGFLLGRVSIIEVHGASADHVGISQLLLANRSAASTPTMFG